MPSLRWDSSGPWEDHSPSCPAGAGRGTAVGTVTPPWMSSPCGGSEGKVSTGRALGYLQARPGPGPGSADQMTGSRRSGHVGLARGRSTYVQNGRLRTSWGIL